MKEDTIVRSQCSQCVHFHNEDKTKNACDAFPEGIPEQLLLNEFMHTQHYEGDNGILFERREA